MDLVELINLFFKNAAGSEISFFLGGILFCLIWLTHYYKLFEKLDRASDLLAENKALLERIRRAQEQRRLRERIEKGQDITEEL
jgi:hypothetical protein